MSLQIEQVQLWIIVCLDAQPHQEDRYGLVEYCYVISMIQAVDIVSNKESKYTGRLTYNKNDTYHSYHASCTIFCGGTLTATNTSIHIMFFIFI